MNKVHRKPENCGAKSCECMISVHRGAVTGHGVNSNKNKEQIIDTKLSACQLNIFRDRMVSLFGN